MTDSIGALGVERPATEFLWLDLTRKCQLACVHCYNASGPEGTHGTMTREDWVDVLDQAVACGVRDVQLIGGEPTMHPDALELAGHALALGLGVEIFSNLVRVTDEWWALFQREGVTLATSYYSAEAGEHDAMTRRRSHARTRANIERAVGLGIPLRVGIIGDSRRTIDAARRDLEALGITRIGVDHIRAFGRGAREQAPDAAGLCGQCGTGRACVGPEGEVSPCVFSGWMGVGNVQDAALADILGGAAMAQANATIRSAVGAERACRPDKQDCAPKNNCRPKEPCQPDQACRPRCGPNTECGPGYPSNECDPKR
ncbi:radical SAM/SPASM domain-containing protein [Streptomyces sp. DSM 44917]|uniref:Radical SAM/SPASM domain-containing protein n=1 Tax=Streptomyces boetiae TaxID=3075541 RepID=A0ABU2L9G2_9ACTN|nr:radical SAM/SPASM domain-containing protein [Streptomyces sp. DSM 44917]MDT0307918.1 radical SAM/SPASM domain-containing protein [Streptomyces sp. DSM 44917]